MGGINTQNKQKFSKMIGKNIKQYRKQRNLTLRELAKQTEYSTGYIGILEKGQSTPNSFVLNEIAQVLNIPISALFGESDWLKNMQEINDPILMEPENKLYINLIKKAITKNIPPDKLERAIEFVNEI
ncbi:MAG: helix-turn-helix domain-containing protein [bacterium]